MQKRNQENWMKSVKNVSVASCRFSIHSTSRKHLKMRENGNELKLTEASDAEAFNFDVSIHFAKTFVDTWFDISLLISFTLHFMLCRLHSYEERDQRKWDERNWKRHEMQESQSNRKSSVEGRLHAMMTLELINWKWHLIEHFVVELELKTSVLWYLPWLWMV